MAPLLWFALVLAGEIYVFFLLSFLFDFFRFWVDFGIQKSIKIGERSMFLFESASGAQFLSFFIDFLEPQNLENSVFA